MQVPGSGKHLCIRQLVFSAVIISFYSGTLKKGKLGSLLLDCIKTEMEIRGVIWEGLEPNSLRQRSGLEAPGRWLVSQQGQHVQK